MIMTPDWQYCIKLTTPDWPAVEQWCLVNLGEFDDTWYKLGIDPAEYLNSGSTRSVWYFKNEKDAVLFALKWTQ
jgi:hypothetical protein